MMNMLRAMLAVAVIGGVVLCASPRQAEAHRYWAGYRGFYGPPVAYRVWRPFRVVHRAYYAPYVVYPSPVYAYPAPYYYPGGAYGY